MGKRDVLGPAYRNPLAWQAQGSPASASNTRTARRTSTAFASGSETWIVSLVADTLLGVTEARDLTTGSELEPADIVWLIARLDEYRELLEYLREH